MKKSKGQIGLEFIISSMVFLITISYAVITISGYLPVYHAHAVDEKLRAESFLLSQDMLFNNLSSPERYVLDPVRISQLSGLCGNYIQVASDLGYEDVSIKIEKIDGTVVLACESPTPSLVREQVITNRYAMLGEDIVLLRVSVFG